MQLHKDNLGQDAGNIKALLNLNSADKFLKQSGLSLSAQIQTHNLPEARDAITIWANRLKQLPAQIVPAIIENSLPALKQLNLQLPTEQTPKNAVI